MTPVPTPVFGWTVNGTPVAGGGLGITTTVGAASEVSGTSQLGLLQGQPGNESVYTVTMLPGSTTILAALVVIGMFLIVRWIVKSIPFM